VDTEDAGASDFHASAFLPQDVAHSSAHSPGSGDIFHRRPAAPIAEDDFADSLQQASHSGFGTSDNDAFARAASTMNVRSQGQDLTPDEHAQWEELDELDALDDISDATHLGTQSQAQEQKIPKAPSFIRRAEKAARWRRPWVRAVLALIALLLVLALAGQWAWRQRDYLALAYPQLRPSLEKSCLVLGCKLGTWHDIDAIKVEASAFKKVQDQQFRVNINLRNAAALPVATPAVLLSLTNADGQTLVRRVFSPADLGLPSSILAPREEYIGNALVDVTDNELSNAIVDYQVLVFYP
jgi:hypothetical protein